MEILPTVEMIPTSALVILGGVLGLSLLLGLWAGRRVRTLEQFLTAGRGAGRLLIAVSLFGSTAAATLLLAVVGGFEARGMAELRPLLAVWLWLPLIMWVWAPVLQRNRLITLPEYLGRRFDPRVRRVTAVAVIGALLGLAGLELAAVGVTLQAMTGQSPLVWAGLTALTVTVYAAWGGQRAVIFTDLLQGAVVVGGLGLLAWLFWDMAGPAELVMGAPLSLRSLATESGTEGDLTALGALVTDVVPIALAGLLGSQALTGRLVAARGEAAAATGALAGLGPLGIFLVVTLGVGGLGGLLLADLGHVPSAALRDAALGSVLSALGTPGTLGILLALVVAAALSTLDALLVGAAAVALVDLAPGATSVSRTGPGRGRLATLVAGMAAFGLAALAGHLGSLSVQGSVLALVLGAPVGLVVLGGLLSRRLGSVSALGGFFASLAGASLVLVLSGAEGDRLPLVSAGLVGTACGVLVLLVGWLRDRRGEPSSLPNLTWRSLAPAWPCVSETLKVSILTATEDDAPKKPTGETPGATTGAEDAEERWEQTCRLPAAMRAARGWDPGCEVLIIRRAGALFALNALRARVGHKSAAAGRVEISSQIAQEANLAADMDVIIHRVA